MRPGILPETPVLQPLRRVSPSRFFSLKECALREIWSASRQESLLPPSPAAQLGTVIHRLLEAAGKGTLNAGNPADIENIWQKLVERTEQGMLQSWLQRSLAALFASKQGRWPIKLEVVPLQGPEKDIPFEPAECESLLREATYTLKQVNDQIGQALKLSDPEKAAVSFANPSPASCRNCCFRPSCKAYQTARNNLSQNRDWPRDVWGQNHRCQCAARSNLDSFGPSRTRSE